MHIDAVPRTWSEPSQSSSRGGRNGRSFGFLFRPTCIHVDTWHHLMRVVSGTIRSEEFKWIDIQTHRYGPFRPRHCFPGLSRLGLRHRFEPRKCPEQPERTTGSASSLHFRSPFHASGNGNAMTGEPAPAAAFGAGRLFHPGGTAVSPIDSGRWDEFVRASNTDDSCPPMPAASFRPQPGLMPDVT